LITGEALRPRYRTPNSVKHLLSPLIADDRVGKWCELIDEDGNRIFEGLFTSCYRLRRNLENSEINPQSGMEIYEIPYSATDYIKGVIIW